MALQERKFLGHWVQGVYVKMTRVQGVYVEMTSVPTTNHSHWLGDDQLAYTSA